MKLNIVEIGIIEKALANYIEFIQDEIEDNMKCYDGDLESGMNMALNASLYLEDVQNLFKKTVKVKKNLYKLYK